MDDGPWMLVSSRTTRQQQDGDEKQRDRENKLIVRDNDNGGAWSKQHNRPHLPTEAHHSQDDSHRNVYRHHHDDSGHKVNPADLIGAPVIVGGVRKSRDSAVESKPVRERERGGLLRVDMRKVREEGAAVKKDGVHESREQFDLSTELWPGISAGEGDGVSGGAEGASSDWSAAVKSKPKPRPQPRPQPVVSEPPVGDGDRSPSDGEGDTAADQKKKKRKKTKSLAASYRAPAGYTMDLGGIMEKITVQPSSSSKSSSSKPISLLTMPSILTKPLRVKDEVKERDPTAAAGHAPNPLDSSAPVTRRGKEREQPKKKKLSSLRKVINKEKEERKRLREEGLPIPTIISSDCATNDDHYQATAAASSAVGRKTYQLHNRRFRDYCTHLVTEEINTCAVELLTDLVRFQDRVYQNEPQKLKTKRRYVCGLREVERSLAVKLRKVDCVIVTPNLDRIESSGGVDERVGTIIKQADDSGIPVVFALSRRRLAWALKKKHSVACVSIFSYAGAEDKFHQLMSLVTEAREEYNAKLRPLTIAAPPPIATTTSEPCDSGESNSGDNSVSDGDSADASAIPAIQWGSLFNTPPINAPPTSGFSWNLYAAEFTPQFVLTTPSDMRHDDHHSN